jgi:DNA-binding MarR family transcriptional regulator
MRADAAADTAEMPAGAPDAREATVPANGSGSAASGPTGAVWDALTGNPGATVAQIAAVAAISKTRTRKELAALEADGHAIRSAGGHEGGKRAPDTWHPATPAENATDGEEAKTYTNTDTGAQAAPEETATVEAAPVEVPAAADEAGDVPAGTAAATAAATGEGSVEPDEQQGMDVEAVTEAQQALTAMAEEIAAALEALASGEGSTALAAAETIYTGSGRARRLVRTAVQGRPRSSATGRLRSHPGELRAKVAAHLAAYPGKEFTPHEIGKVIEHSAGAVANALDRLVELGLAELTCDRPRRFTATPSDEAPSDEAANPAPNSAANPAGEAASGEHTGSDDTSTHASTYDAAAHADDAAVTGARHPES